VACSEDPIAGPTFTVRGVVRDTANLPISGAQVEPVAPGGTVTVTDGNGQFILPWPFSATVTVRVSKERFHATRETRARARVAETSRVPAVRPGGD
jgi:hypothetical protein